MKKAVLFSLLTLAISGCATTAENVTTPVSSAPASVPVKPKTATPAAASASTSTQPIPPAMSTPVTSEALHVAADKEKQKELAAEPEQYPDIWSRIRKGYGLKPLDSPHIARHEQWFANNTEYMQAMMDRARMYLFYIVEEVEKRGVPMEIALLPAIESAYKPYAYSRAKASGLWQFIAPTGRLYGLNMNWWYDERRDVIASTRAALDYLEKLHKDFDGDWHLALAAYNAGEGKIGRMMEYNRKRNLPTEYQFLKLKQETVHYVPKLIAMANIIANPDKYGIKLLSIPNQPYFVRVDVGSQIDLGVVSKLTDVPVNELQYINPHLNRWATHPEGPHYLLLPVDKKEAFLEGLSTLPADQRVQWFGHEVKRGDTLASVANRYHVSIEAVRSANKLTSNILRVGQSLMIPVSSRSLIPVYATPIKQAAPIKPQTAWNAGGSNKTPVIHRVRAGETLWSIARRYGVLVSQIVEWNVLEANSVLQLGQRLRIFPSGVPAAKIDDDSPNS